MHENEGDVTQGVGRIMETSKDREAKAPIVRRLMDSESGGRNALAYASVGEVKPNSLQSSAFMHLQRIECSLSGHCQPKRWKEKSSVEVRMFRMMFALTAIDATLREHHCVDQIESKV